MTNSVPNAGAPTVFLDRDGVVNVPTGIPHTYVTSWEGFAFLPGVARAIRELNEGSFRVVVVTNQRGVARGALAHETLDGIHSRMLADLEAEGAHVDGVYVCPHEGGCRCRKPGTGLLEQADADVPCDRARSWMVGDSPSDVEAGRRFGVRTVLVGGGEASCGPDFVRDDLPRAAALILGKESE